MSISLVLRAVRYISVLMVTVFIWLLLGMVYTDRFVRPFDRFEPWLMPWKAPVSVPSDAGVEWRLTIMQDQLDASNRVSRYAFLVMTSSLAILCIYLTLVYQQKQRRARENRLLLIRNQEIVRRNEFIRYISATIGHEFKNNLGRIKRRLDLLPDLPSESRLRIDDNLNKLFADIDIFKKISDERESALIDFSRVDLRAMLESLVAQYSDLADFSFQDKVSMPAITASPTLLKTVFENLIDNSIKYKKPEQARARIFLSCLLDTDARRQYLSLSFRDEGVGMDEHEADLCFYKGKGTQGGWGRGLYYVKYVVGLHAGKIRVGKEYTAPGTGTEIIIKLPFIEEALNV
ncbi:putative Histidine kinase [Candidatus Sulfobium mesophilum]|uniref:histidine kinase n=1 Tax=Candidatus Sulfobium mesophilum TaxID=2016548 RepID=A0A2U3QF50_9BACT|nr:putative Histidine kinase [Candidatus Sulfobium mesophilum]